MERALQELKTLRIRLDLARRELALKEEVLKDKGTTRHEVLKARAEVDLIKSKIAEAEKAVELAKLNLEACDVKAPFTGYLAVRYRQPFETVLAQRSPKLFSLVDKAKVYAVANVPEKELARFKKGAKAAFVHLSGRRYEGVVEKVEPYMDPKSGTTKVYVLMDNSKGELRIGMRGVLEAE